MRYANFRLTTFLSAVMGLVLCACTTVGPDYRIPDEAKINQIEAGKSFKSAKNKAFNTDALPDKWWKLYKDESLNNVVKKALAANVDLRIAAANLARMQAVFGETRMAETPEVAVTAAPIFGRSSANAKGYSERLPDSWKFDGGIGMSYQIDLFGKIARGIEAARADVEAAKAAYDLVRITVAAETARAYVEICATGEQIKVADDLIALQNVFVKKTKRLVDAGKGTSLDISRARSEAEQTMAMRPPLVAKRNIARFRLATLMGDMPNSLPSEIATCAAIPKTQSIIPVGDGASLLRRRPDIREAERQLSSANAKIGVATADLYPNIRFGITAGSSGLMSHLGDIDAFTWGVGPLISWSFPSTSTARHRIAQAQLSHQAALANFDGKVLGALREAESALERYGRELDRNAILQRAQANSALASEQAHNLYRYGRADFLATLDANRTLTRTQSALAESSAQLANYQIELFLALGGGWK